MKIKFPRSHKNLFTPKNNKPVLIMGDQIRLFIIKGNNGYPSQIHIGTYKDGQKISGHNLLPQQLTDKTFCFEDLKTMEQYKCPCGKESCLYGAYLRVCINNYRKQMGALK